MKQGQGEDQQLVIATRTQPLATAATGVDGHHLASRNGEKNIRIAASREQLGDCFRLVYRSYLRCGYTDLTSVEMRINLWNALPTTRTLFATSQGHLAGTLTCVMDSEAVLPADSFCNEAINELRAQGRRLCELSGLATDAEYADTMTAQQLFRYALIMTKEFTQGTDFIITVHPRHQRFYHGLLLFDALEHAPQYAPVKGAPGILMRLNLETACARYRQRYGGFRGTRNLHKFYFLDDQVQIRQAVREGLKARRKQLNKETLEHFLFMDGEVMKEPQAVQTFHSHWAAWNAAS